MSLSWCMLPFWTQLCLLKSTKWVFFLIQKWGICRCKVQPSQLEKRQNMDFYSLPPDCKMQVWSLIVPTKIHGRTANTKSDTGESTVRFFPWQSHLGPSPRGIMRIQQGTWGFNKGHEDSTRDMSSLICRPGGWRLKKNAQKYGKTKPISAKASDISIF